MHGQFGGRNFGCDDKADQKREYPGFHNVVDEGLAAPAQGDVRGFDENEHFVAKLELHFFDRPGGDNRSDFTDACLDDHFTEDFVGDNTLNCAWKLIADALLHNSE